MDFVSHRLLHIILIEDQVEEDEIGGSCGMNGGGGVVYKLWLGKSEAKRELERPRSR
jgi:hypothetical protein